MAGFQANVQSAFDLGKHIALGIDDVVFQYRKVFVAIGTGMLDGGNVIWAQSAFKIRSVKRGLDEFDGGFFVPHKILFAKNTL